MTTREPFQPGDRHVIETKEAFDLLPGKADAAGDGKSVERGLQPWERQFVSHGPNLWSNDTRRKMRENPDEKGGPALAGPPPSRPKSPL